ncbi:MSMEG_0565 family glycosyltransferase [Phormidesmis sp. 146-35]
MTQKLRIALLTYSTKPRGSVIHTLELAEALHSQGHYVCVYALDKDGLGFDRSLACEVKLVPAQPAPDNIDDLIHQRIQEFVNYLFASDQVYDFYHAQDCISANALSILRSLGKIPHFIRTVHHIEDYESAYLQRCQDRSIRDADLCFCVSHRWQIALEQTYQIKALRVMNGVDQNRFSPIPNRTDFALRQRLNLRGNPIYLTVGGIEPRKNSIALLNAFIEVLASHPNAQLIVAGGATLFDYQDYRDEFFELAELANVTDALIFPGVISDVELPALYRLADAFVFPSVKEGWGLVVMEAIASGIPIITANQPPFTEFLSCDQAILIDPHSSTAIAQAMKTVIHPEISKSLVQQSRTVCDRYTWEASAKQHVAHYNQSLQLCSPQPTVC